MQLSSVVLPEPLGPISPTTWPGKDLHIDVDQGIDPRAARAEMLREVLDPHDRLSARLGHWPTLPTASASAGSTLSASRMPSVLAARQTAMVMTNTIATLVGIEHQPPRKIRLEDENERQPGEIAEDPHRQGLLDDQADDGAVRRADEFQAWRSSAPCPSSAYR